MSQGYREKHHPADGTDTIHINRCADCNELYYDHAYADEWTYNAEYHWKECTRAKGCSSIKSQGTHAFGDGWIVVEEATTRKEGLEERSCWCGYKETREIPATGSAGCKSNEGVTAAFISSGSLSLMWFAFRRIRRTK